MPSAGEIWNPAILYKIDMPEPSKNKKNGKTVKQALLRFCHNQRPPYDYFDFIIEEPFHHVFTEKASYCRSSMQRTHF